MCAAVGCSRTILNDPPHRTYQVSYINPRPRGTLSHTFAGLEGRFLQANRMALALGPLAEREQRLVTARLGALAGDAQHLVRGEVRGLEAGRRLGERVR